MSFAFAKLIFSIAKNFKLKELNILLEGQTGTPLRKFEIFFKIKVVAR